jgi:hypothetical protein
VTHRSPLVTLAGLVIAFAVMFGVNIASSAPPGSYESPGPTQAAPPPSTTSAPAPPAQTASASPDETTAPSPSAAATKDGGSEFPARIVYAGRTRDDSAAIAVAVLGEKAAAYLCDGRNVESWLRGTVEENEIKAQSKDGAKLEAKLDGSRLKGTIEVDDQKLRFEIAEAKKPAGLYRAKGSKTTIGWIVLPDGSQVGIQTTGEESSAAPELDPTAPQVSVEGEQLDADPVSGDEDL